MTYKMQIKNTSQKLKDETPFGDFMDKVFIQMNQTHFSKQEGAIQV